MLCLMKQVSEACGGDDEEFFKQHCREVIESHPEERIEEAIECYKEQCPKRNYYQDRSLNEWYTGRKSSEVSSVA